MDSRTDVPFAVKIETFFIPLTPRPPIGHVGHVYDMSVQARNQGGFGWFVRTTPRDHQVRFMICKIIRVNQFRSNFIIYTGLEYIQYSQSATDSLRPSCIQLLAVEL